MATAYEERARSRKVFVKPEAAYATLRREFDAPPAFVWEWLNDPHKRSRWMRGRRWSVLSKIGGRTGTGTRNHCDHGMGSVTETILDWNPFDYFTVELVPSSGPLLILQTYQLEPLDEGQRTRLSSLLTFQQVMPEWLARQSVTPESGCCSNRILSVWRSSWQRTVFS